MSILFLLMASVVVRTPKEEPAAVVSRAPPPRWWSGAFFTAAVLVLAVAASVWGIIVSVLLAQRSSSTTTSTPGAPPLPSPPAFFPGASVAIAVVGGGPAGAYSYWRLQSQQRADVHLYEQSDRLGGRTYSVPVNGACPEVVAELGGMRIRVGADKLVLRVVELLNITVGCGRPSGAIVCCREHRLCGPGRRCGGPRAAP